VRSSLCCGQPGGDSAVDAPGGQARGARLRQRGRERRHAHQRPKLPGQFRVIVGANGVKIDLNGHTISGNLTNDGILNNGHAGVVIKDGTISHFLEGVVLDTGSNNNTVTNVRVSVNAGDGIFVTASNDQLTGNQVEGNSGDGIDLTSNSSNVVISGNTALNNGHGGIEVCGVRVAS
jgi:parallel beta-helix repeat protein